MPDESMASERQMPYAHRLIKSRRASATRHNPAPGIEPQSTGRTRGDPPISDWSDGVMEP